MKELFRVIRRQTVVGWCAGLVAGVGTHCEHCVWWLGLLVTLGVRAGMDMLYAWHDLRDPPQENETRVVKE